MFLISNFPDAEVKRYESLIAALDLPDLDDRHILATAIRCQATVIVRPEPGAGVGCFHQQVLFQGTRPERPLKSWITSGK